MKPQKWRLSWWTLLFITTSDFRQRPGSSHRTMKNGPSKICGRPYPFKFFKSCLPQILLGPFSNNLSQILFPWNLAVIMFFKFPSDLYQEKRKMNVTFKREFFTFFTSSGWALFLERSYFIVNNQSAFCSS